MHATPMHSCKPFTHIVLVIGALAGLVSLHAYWFTDDLDLWPDVVCQTFLGWRVAAGDGLYTDLWDSHPPVAVLYSALFHLFLAPSVGTAKLIVLSNALLFGAVQAFGAWVAGVRSRLVLAAVALLAAGAYAQWIANARSEDFVILLGTFAILCALRFHLTPSGWMWPAACGVALGVAAFTKPAAAVSGIVALALLSLSGNSRRGVGFAVIGGCVPIAIFAAYFLVDRRYLFAYDQIVVYGRHYFRPLTFEVLISGVQAFLSDTTLACLALLAVATACSRSLREEDVRWRRALVVLALLWLPLEAITALAQTTHFPYVFFPAQAAVLTTAFLLVARSCATSTVTTGNSILGARLITVALPVAAVGMFCFIKGIVPPRSALGYVVGVSILGALASSLWQRGTSRDRLPVASIATFVLAVVAFTLFGAQVRHTRFGGDYNARFVALANVFIEHRGDVGDQMLWFDAAPTVGYLAAIPSAIPEYLSPPLFNDYASDARWQGVSAALDRVNVVMVWQEWLNPLGDVAPNVAPLPAFMASRAKLVTQYDEVADVAVVDGRGSIKIYVRKGAAPALRVALTHLSSGPAR